MQPDKATMVKVSKALTIFQRSDVNHSRYTARIKLPKLTKTSPTKYKNIALDTESEAEAIELGKRDVINLEVKQAHNIPVHTKSFERAYSEWVETALTFKSKERRASHLSNGNGYFFEYFNQRDMGKIDEHYIDGYWPWRMQINSIREKENRLHPNAKLKPAVATLYAEKDSLNQFFKWAAKRKLITHKPEIIVPVKNERNRRPAFTLNEYVELRRGMRKWAMTTHPTTQQFYQRNLIHYAFRFCMESGLRPKELFVLKWSDISYFIDDYHQRQMLISVSPQTKTGGRECVPKQQAILTLNRWLNGVVFPDGNTFPLARYTKKKDFIFANYWGDYYEAHERATKKMFDHCNLLTDSHARERTFYSGRHYYATERLLYGENIDAYKLAKNMGTSVEMIEKHYGHTQNQQNAVVLTSRKKRNSRRNIYVNDIPKEKIIPFPLKKQA